MLGFQVVGRDLAPLTETETETERVDETALSASKFLATMARSAKTWGIFSSPGDSKLTPDNLSFK